MLLYREMHRSEILSSDNLIDWKREGELHSDDNPLEGIEGELLEVEAEVSFDNYVFVDSFGFRLRGFEIRQKIREDMNLMGVDTPRFKRNDPIKLRIFVDSMGVEVFAGDGDYYITRSHFFDPANRSLELFVDSYFDELKRDSAVGIERLSIWELKSIWE